MTDAFEPLRVRLRALDAEEALTAHDDALFAAASRAAHRARRATFAAWGVGALCALASLAWWSKPRPVAVAAVHATGEGRWSLADGSRVEALAGSRVTFHRTPDGVTHVALTTGTVTVHAARTAARRLVVEHGAWGAWVHGTRFRVTALTEGVRVSVDEGDVLVRGPATEGVHVTAGQRVLADSSGVRAEVMVADLTPPPPLPVRRGGVEPSEPRVSPLPASTPPLLTGRGGRGVRSDARAVHDATIALARGEHVRALAGFARYLRDHPHGVLVEDALAGAMDARWRMGDRAGARLAAERYLSEFPRGVAGQRARRIVTETGAQP